MGLDQGAHGNSAITGFGYVVGHPELTIVGLSEEVAKVKCLNGDPCDLKVGDKVEDEYCQYEVVSSNKMRVKRVRMLIKERPVEEE